MRSRNRRVGDAIRGQLKDLLRSWRLEVTDHDDNARYGPPGDLAVGNGNGILLYVEVKAVAETLRLKAEARGQEGRPYTRGRRDYPGRPYITTTGHAQLEDAGGVYAFCSYVSDDAGPHLTAVRWCLAQDLDLSRVVGRGWAMPWRDHLALPVLTGDRLARLIVEEGELA